MGRDSEDGRGICIKQSFQKSQLSKGIWEKVLLCAMHKVKVTYQRSFHWFWYRKFYVPFVKSNRVGRLFLETFSYIKATRHDSMKMKARSNSWNSLKSCAIISHLCIIISEDKNYNLLVVTLNCMQNHFCYTLFSVRIDQNWLNQTLFVEPKI